MANDKNKKNNDNHMSNEMAGEFGKLLILGLAAVAAWVAIIALSFSASLAAMGERYRDHGYNEWEILKSKTWRAIKGYRGHRNKAAVSSTIGNGFFTSFAAAINNEVPCLFHSA